MAKTNISQWDTVAGNNADLNSISVAEGWLPSTVNNFEREEISQLAKFYDDFGGNITVGGTANAITLTTTTVYTALAAKMRLRFTAASNNSGAVTLNLDSLGAKAGRKIVAGADVALVTGDILAGVDYDIVYSTAANSAAGGWIISPSALYLTDGSAITVGTYTPTLFNTTNVAASTPQVTGYYQIGTRVTVFGVVTIDPTANTADTVLGMSLPIASNIGNAVQLGGTGAAAIVNESWSITGDAANDRATFETTCQSLANHQVAFQFSYQVL